MRAVYSTQLWMENSVSGSGNLVYTPRTGTVGVIRFMTVTFGTNVGSGGWFVRQHPSTAVLWSGAGVASLVLDTHVLDCHIVLNPGDVIEIATYGGWAGDFSGSGYELQLP